MQHLLNAMYEAVNDSVILHIPKTAKCILDIGCGSGNLGREIKSRINCEVVGVTYSESEANAASAFLDRVLIKDLNYFDTQELGQFDCIICSHILEHLYHPEDLLIKLRRNLATNGVLIIALPNTLHWKQRLEFLKGNFKYTDGGVMDRTHFRFFDWNTSVELVSSSGFKVLFCKADGYLPMPGVRRFVKSIASILDRLVSKFAPGLFGVQFIIVASI
ncbi:MAG: class I SAM-dependent methyltransferase [Mojavia pulchra JT2-VF2]|jgi:SAM-dependent methyltransferase|uniref:Class I SAM-dependent methyltransferase n=1 Tax=Mojavia pulchra JT2-VF2 TaxID=287848 RepID=A0A951PVY2_9NOST|nr:class I SAM-dependent methyltransferase [Mojavia pulchra JT2-VF2]